MIANDQIAPGNPTDLTLPKSKMRDSDQFTPTNLADPILLNKIDRLFACGVGDYVALPQLVVVGDQSSGKSSVLEGLTELPFPRDSGLCTRFATQITFRRAQHTSISISILPAYDASAEHVNTVKEWGKTGLKSLGPKDFEQIMQEVCLS